MHRNKKKSKSKAKAVETTTKLENSRMETSINYIMDQLHSQEVAFDPLTKISLLYTLKSTIEKSLTPRLAQCCVNRDILDIVMQILDKEFHPRDKTNEVVLYTQALELMWLFSNLDNWNKEPLLSNTRFVPLLTHFLDITGSFYVYRPTFRKELEKLCDHVSFLQQNVTAVPMTDKIWKDILLYNPNMTLCGPITQVHQCNLIHKDGRREPQSIARHLINKGLGWTRIEKASTPSTEPLVKNVGELVHPSDLEDLLTDPVTDVESEEPGQSFNDVHFLSSIGGPYFWAHMGTEAVEIVSLMTESLQRQQSRLTLCVPSVGDPVAISEKKKKDPGMPAVFRGRVVDISKDELVVFAIDYGTVRKVKPCNVYCLPESPKCLSALDPQAKVCSLAGVQPPPADPLAVEFVLPILSNFTRRSDKAGVAFEAAGGLDHLLSLIRCGSSNIQLHAIRLLCNVTSVHKVSMSQDWTRFIRLLLETPLKMCRMLTVGQVIKSEFRNKVAVALSALSNILLGKPMYREHFFDVYGHFIVLNLIRLLKRSQPLTGFAYTVLKAAYPNVISLEEIDCNNATQLNNKIKTGDSAAGKQQSVAAGKKENATAELLKKLSIQKGAGLQEACSKEGDSADNTREHAQCSCSSSRSQTRTDPSSLDTDLTGLAATNSSPANPSPASEGSTLSTEDVVPHNAVTAQMKTPRYYEYGEYTLYRDDQTHHVLHYDDIAKISPTLLLELICGMLNSKGGTIFLGITKKGYVRGMKMSRDDRDCVRLSIDKSMVNTTPEIPFNRLHVDFVQVMQELSSGELEPVPDLFVTEIHMRASDELECFTIRKSGQCLQRVGRTQLKLTEQLVREQVVQQEEAKYLPVVQSLRQQIQALQEKMEMDDSHSKDIV